MHWVNHPVSKKAHLSVNIMRFPCILAFDQTLFAVFPHYCQRPGNVLYWSELVVFSHKYILWSPHCWDVTQRKHWSYVSNCDYIQLNHENDQRWTLSNVSLFAQVVIHFHFQWNNHNIFSKSDAHILLSILLLLYRLALKNHVVSISFSFSFFFVLIPTKTT